MPARQLRRVGQAGVRALGRVDPYLGLSRAVTDTDDVVLAYHSVGDPGKYGNVSVERFRRDLEHLTERYEVVDLPAVVRPSDEKRVAITFDDGYRNFSTQALPVLREFEAPVTVFVVPSFVGDRTDQFWRLRESPTDPYYGEVGDRRSPPFPGDDQVMLSERELRELVADPLVTVGNHTRSHPDLAAIGDPDRLRTEIEGGKRDLMNLLGVSVDRFSYPYGRLSEAAERVVEDTHELAVTTATAPVGDCPDPHRIPRVSGHLPQWRLRWELTDLRWRFSPSV